MSVALVVAFVIKEDLVQVFDFVLAGRGVETIRDLLKFDGMALAVTDEDNFDDAVGIRARGREDIDGAFIGAEVVSQLILLAVYRKTEKKDIPYSTVPGS